MESAPHVLNECLSLERRRIRQLSERSKDGESRGGAGVGSMTGKRIVRVCETPLAIVASTPTIRFFRMRLHAGLPARDDGLPSPSLTEIIHTDGRGCPSCEMPHASPHEASSVPTDVFFIRSPALPSVVRNPLTTDGKAGPRMQSNSPGDAVSPAN